MSTFAESGRLLVCFVVGVAIGVYVTLMAITVGTRDVEKNAASRRGAPTDRKPREN